MRRMIAFMLVVAVLTVGSNSSQARIAHADSEILAIDTVTSVDDAASCLPQTTRLASIYPNPFNPSATIAFDLAKDGQVELAIFDVRGRLVSIVESGNMAAGWHQAVWHGQDRDGRSVPSGTYVCRLIAGKHDRDAAHDSCTARTASSRGGAADDSVRLDDRRTATPLAKDTREQRPESAVRGLQARSPCCSSQDFELMSQGNVLEDQFAAGT
jgi:hypothetical protein